MKITKIGHSCLLVEEGNAKILIDPGTFAFIEGKTKPEDFKDISVVLVTHAHADHVDITALKTILKNNDAAVISNQGVQEFLKAGEIPVKILEEGALDVEGFHIEALSVAHEKVLGPLPENTAYIINKKLLHPGDSLNSGLFKFKGTPVLALPTIAPWNKRFEVAEFAEEMKPQIIIPIHDGFVKDFFLKGQDEIYGKYFEERGMSFNPLNGNREFVEI